MNEEGKYIFLKSDGVTRLLSDANIQWLRQKKENNKEPYWLPTEQVVAIQYITKTVVSDREGIWNHTILIPIDEYIRRTNPYKLFSKYFITENMKAPISLKPIEE